MTSRLLQAAAGIISPGSARPNAVEIDLAALAANVRVVRELVGDQTKIFAAVKADAYGFGLERVATEAVAAGVDALAMADAADAVRIRAQGVTVPLLLYPGALLDRELMAEAAEHDLMLTMTDAETVCLASRLARQPVGVFLKVDVGMERLGSPPSEIANMAELVQGSPQLELKGLYTHMHAGAGDSLLPYLRWQLERFQSALDDLRRHAVAVPLVMAASSPALALLQEPLFDAVDPGHLIYGLAPPVPGRLPGLRPLVRSLRTRLIQVKPVERSEFGGEAPFSICPGMRIAVLPIGRADGLQFLTTGEILVRGRRCPIVGKLSLEHTRIDVTNVAEASLGDEAVIIGQQGGEAITLEQVCDATGLDQVGVTTSIRRSIVRHYIQPEER